MLSDHFWIEHPRIIVKEHLMELYKDGRRESAAIAKQTTTGVKQANR